MSWRQRKLSFITCLFTDAVNCNYKHTFLWSTKSLALLICDIHFAYISSIMFTLHFHSFIVFTVHFSVSSYIHFAQDTIKLFLQSKHNGELRTRNCWYSPVATDDSDNVLGPYLRATGKYNLLMFSQLVIGNRKNQYI